MRSIRSPNARPDENRLISVVKKIVEMQRSANRRVRSNVNAHLAQLRLIAVEDHLRQAKRRNPVAHHPADFVHALEHSNPIAALRQLDRDRDARRTRADDRNALPFIGLAIERHLVEIRVRNVILDARDVDRRPAPTLDAIALALIFVIAHQRAHHAQRIVVEKHAPRLGTLARQKQPNHLGNVGLDRATLEPAERFFALQTPTRLIDNVNSHCDPSQNTSLAASLHENFSLVTCLVL